MFHFGREKSRFGLRKRGTNASSETEFKAKAHDRKRAVQKWWVSRAWRNHQSDDEPHRDSRSQQATKSAVVATPHTVATKQAAVEVVSDDASAGSHPSVLNLKRSRRTHPTQGENVPAAFSAEKPPRRAIRFADEEGKPITSIHYTSRTDDSAAGSARHNWVRFIVLMVAPAQKKFEFLHVYYNVLEENPVGDLLFHIRDISTHRHLAKQEYVGICRLADGVELFNTRSVQDYKLERHEVVVAIPKGHKVAELMPIANQLVKNNGKVLRIMKRSRWEKKRIKHRRRKTDEEISLQELEGVLDGELVDYYKTDNVMLPRLIQAGAFFVPLMAIRNKSSGIVTTRQNEGFLKEDSSDDERGIGEF